MRTGKISKALTIPAQSAAAMPARRDPPIRVAVAEGRRKT
jgi:hypothetical protein